MPTPFPDGTAAERAFTDGYGVRIVQAVADGMQLQWMLDPEVDMAATIDAVFTLLGTQRRGATDA